MDVNDFRKHAIPQIEAGRKIDAIRQVIRRERYADLDKREYLKESFKPITDKLEEEIGELTDEIKDLKMLPAPRLAIEAPGPSSISSTHQAAIREKPKVVETIDLDGGLSQEAIESITSSGFPMPSELFGTKNPEEVKKVIKEINTKMQSLGGKKGKVINKDKVKANALDREMDGLREYKDRI